ncbi:hypothetical protein AB9P05_21195 [Roseivirga sp. BDSF3-8]|uniref:hypothetical protein n=1 Tax=Roseivirga sp. BDSF3-8 TaxID=3241598 RepID=UPI0035323FAC
MKKYSKITITSVLLAVAVGVGIFYFFQVKSLQNDLLQSRERAEIAEDELVAQKKVLGIDSLLLAGKHDEALTAYKALQTSEKGTTNAFIDLRIELAQRLITLQEEVRALNSRDRYAMDSSDTLQTEDAAAADRVRQLDSLSFALTKAKAQVENLERQFVQRSFGEYLTFTSSKGNKVDYVGKVENGKANGRGVALFSTGSRYEGEWKNNMRHGKGIFYWPDGEYYSGEYKNDQRHGQGTYYWPNGEKYTGSWENNERNGEGTFYGKEGEIVADGIWKDDELVKAENK